MIRQANLQVSVEFQPQLAAADAQCFVLFVRQHLRERVRVELPTVSVRQLGPARLGERRLPWDWIPEISVWVRFAIAAPLTKTAAPVQSTQNIVQGITFEPARVAAPEDIQSLDELARPQLLESREGLRQRLALRGECIVIGHATGRSILGHTGGEGSQCLRGQQRLWSCPLGQFAQ